MVVKAVGSGVGDEDGFELVGWTDVGLFVVGLDEGFMLVG